MQVGTTKDQGLYNKPSVAVRPGALAAGTIPQYNVHIIFSWYYLYTIGIARNDSGLWLWIYLPVRKVPPSYRTLSIKLSYSHYTVLKTKFSEYQLNMDLAVSTRTSTTVLYQFFDIHYVLKQKQCVHPSVSLYVFVLTATKMV